MTENDFWRSLGKAWENGVFLKLSGMMESMEPEEQYLMAHTWLPRDFDKFSREDLVQMGTLLFKKSGQPNTKRAIMIVLAHQQNSKDALELLELYNIMPDIGLEIFAELALEESTLWNDEQWEEPFLKEQRAVYYINANIA